MFCLVMAEQDYVKLAADAISRLPEENQGEIQPQEVRRASPFSVGLGGILWHLWEVGRQAPGSM